MATLTIDFPDEYVKAMKALAAEKGMSESVVLRQALALYQMDHLKAKDGLRRAYLDEDGLEEQSFSKRSPEDTPLQERLARDTHEQLVRFAANLLRQQLLGNNDSPSQPRVSANKLTAILDSWAPTRWPT